MFLGSFAAMRAQAGVGSADFVHSMILRHSGAILMCGQALITDTETTALRQQIVASHQKEISQMEAILRRY